MYLEAGADIQEDGPAALEAAAHEAYVEAVALLLDRGADINSIGSKLSPLQAAA